MIYSEFNEKDYSFSFSFGGWDYFTTETVLPDIRQIEIVFYKRRVTGRKFIQITIKEYENAELQALKGTER